MLYIFMALYAEAAPFIAQMKLKRVNDSGKFVLYQDEPGRRYWRLQARAK